MHEHVLPCQRLTCFWKGFARDYLSEEGRGSLRRWSLMGFYAKKDWTMLSYADFLSLCRACRFGQSLILACTIDEMMGK